MDDPHCGEEKAEQSPAPLVAGYAGCVSAKYNKRKEVTGFQVSFIYPKKARRPNPRFTVSVFGSVDKARAAAEQFRRQRSDDLGKTVLLHSCFTTSFEVSFKQYVAGCYDGDGGITLICNGTRVRVSFTQCGPSMVVAPTIITHFQQAYGGKAGLRSHTLVRNQRPAWDVYVENTAAQILLEHISEHGVVKKPQADLVLPIVRNHVPLRRSLTSSIVPPYVVTGLKLLKTQYVSVPIDPARLTVPYLAGLFDAEGCVYMDKSGTLRASITQAQCVPLLHAIRQVLQTGSVSTKRITFTSSFALAFLKSISSFLDVKKAQVDLVLAHPHLLTRGALSDPETKERTLLSERLAALKREGAVTDEQGQSRETTFFHTHTSLQATFPDFVLVRASGSGLVAVSAGIFPEHSVHCTYSTLTCQHPKAPRPHLHSRHYRPGAFLDYEERQTLVVVFRAGAASVE